MSNHAELTAHSILMSAAGWGAPEGEEFKNVRADFIRSLTEDMTGVPWGESRLTSYFPAAELTAEQIERANAYQSCRDQVQTEVPTDPARFMRYCYLIAEERLSHTEALALITPATTLAAD